MDDFTPNQPWLLVSDLDDTLLGDDRALERFREAIEYWMERLSP